MNFPRVMQRSATDAAAVAISIPISLFSNISFQNCRSVHKKRCTREGFLSGPEQNATQLFFVHIYAYAWFAIADCHMSQSNITDVYRPRPTSHRTTTLTETFILAEHHNNR